MPTEHNESTTVTVTMIFRDRDGVLQIPNATPEYRIDNLDATVVQVLDWTVMPGSLASSMDVDVTAAQNIFSGSKDLNRIRVTARFTYGSPARSGKEEYIYAIKNLGGV